MTPNDVRDLYSHVQFIFGHTTLQAKLAHVALVQFHKYGEEWSPNLKFALQNSCELVLHFLSDPEFRNADDRVDASIMASFAEEGCPSTDLMLAFRLIGDFITTAKTVQDMDGDNLFAAVQNFEFVNKLIVEQSITVTERLKTECGRIIRWVEEHARFLKNCNGFVPSEIQWEILKALDGQAMTADALQAAINRSRHTLFGGKSGAGGINELVERGIVKNERKVGGYYRPDSPPKAH